MGTIWITANTPPPSPPIDEATGLDYVEQFLWRQGHLLAYGVTNEEAMDAARAVCRAAVTGDARSYTKPAFIKGYERWRNCMDPAVFLKMTYK